jgi:EF-P beta-lysylation protein EpmB
MITPSRAGAQPDSWQAELAAAISEPADLLHTLGLPPRLLPAAQAAAARFPLRVTRHYLSLIRRGDPKDPLLRQILPLEAELADTPGFVEDPVGDREAQLGHGLLHKYRGRTLLIATGACAIHCRYCFRRNYPYAENAVTRHWDEVMAQLKQMPEIDEVILSGGDPLTLSDARLQQLVRALESLPHLRRLRIHSRLPSLLPSRITPGLLGMFSGSRLGASLVLHCNHPRELSQAMHRPLRALREAGVTLLNQSVLLKGVNDDVETLAGLSTTLFDYGVLPYYLHALDPVSGAAHFAVPDTRAIQLHTALRARLPGYLLPRLVREIAGQPSKTPLATP